MSTTKSRWGRMRTVAQRVMVPSRPPTSSDGGSIKNKEDDPSPTLTDEYAIPSIAITSDQTHDLATLPNEPVIDPKLFLSPLSAVRPVNEYGPFAAVAELAWPSPHPSTLKEPESPAPPSFLIGLPLPIPREEFVDEHEANNDVGSSPEPTTPTLPGPVLTTPFDLMPTPPVAPQIEPTTSSPMLITPHGSDHEAYEDSVLLLQTPEQEAEEVVAPSTGGPSDRILTPSIHVPINVPFAGPISPGPVPPHPDEHHLLNPEHDPYEPVGGLPRDENEDNIMMPTPVNVDRARSIHEATSAQGVNTGGVPHGFDIDTGEPSPPSPRSGLPGDVLMQPPAYHDYATISPSPTFDGIPMDCGTMPSHLYSLGQGSGRQILSHQAPEQRNAGGEGQARGWVIPFTDRRTISPHQLDSRESADGVHNATHGFDAHEAFSPVSPPSLSSSGCDSRLQRPASPLCAFAPPTKPSYPQDDQPFHAHGWIECLLPDESLYYVHHAYQVVTDVDLSDEKILDAVMAYLEDHGDVMPPGRELWLRDTGSHGGEFHPLRYLVDHTKRSVLSDSPHETNSGSKPQHGHQERKDGRLDAKYQYWSFMETHPAHTSLSLGAYQEALDALNWASTNGLMPAHGSAPTRSPFTREECQTFTALLRSIDKLGETPLRTHTVSKILLRVVCWRQSRPRPNSLRPVDAGRGGLRGEDRSTPVRSGILMLTAGVYACLATVIVLCLSQTFVWIVGIGAILFSSSPLVSNVVALMQSKANGRSMELDARRDMLIFSASPETPRRWYRYRTDSP